MRSLCRGTVHLWDGWTGTICGERGPRDVRTTAFVYVNCEGCISALRR